MDKKAIAEIRKTLSKDKCRIDKITGCFVGDDGKVITDLRETFNALQDEDLEKYCELFKKALSGKLGKNLFNMEFPLAQEQQGGRQYELYHLLRSDFQNLEMIRSFCQQIIDSLDMAGRYLILLAHGAYDIPKITSDGQNLDDASDYVYLYMVCCICPVTEVKEGLCYDEETLTFVNKKSDLGVQMPVLGFLYPAFNDRMPDIHSLLYYAKKEDERHLELVDAIVGADNIPKTEKDQKEVFNVMVEKTLGRGCDFDSVMSVTEAVNEMIKENQDDPEPLELGKNEVKRILRESGAPHDALSESFDEEFDEQVGEGSALMAESIGGRTVTEIKSPSIKISVKSDMTSMLQTRILDGHEYLVIPIQDDIEVNGIRILPKKIGTEAGADA